MEVFSQPEVISGTLADYRTAYDVDRPRWEEDNKAGLKIQVPLCVVWGANGNLGNQQVLDIWQEVAVDVRGEAVPDCYHYIPEEQLAATLSHILRFADELGLP